MEALLSTSENLHALLTHRLTKVIAAIKFNMDAKQHDVQLQGIFYMSNFAITNGIQRLVLFT